MATIRQQLEAKYGKPQVPVAGNGSLTMRQKLEQKYGKVGQPFQYQVTETPEMRANKIAGYQAEAAESQKESDKANSFSGMIRNFGKAFVSNIAPSEVGLGKTIQKTFGNQSGVYSDAIQLTSATQAQLVKAIREKEARGEDINKLKYLYNEGQKELTKLQGGLAEESNIPTTGQVAGQLGGTALDLLTAGTYGRATAGMKTGSLAPKMSIPTIIPRGGKGFVSGLKDIAKGSTLGYGFDVTQGLQDKEENPYSPGVGTLIGAGIPLLGKTGSGLKNVVKDTVLPENIMQRVARIPKSQQAKFEKTAGESVGSYLKNRGIFGNDESIISQLYKRFTDSKNTADDAIASLKGVFKPTPVKSMVSELLQREIAVSSPGALSKDIKRVQQLKAKLDTVGLDMTEINEVKRLYERNVRLDYLKQQLPEKTERANNIDNAVREWQFSTADKLGLKNLPEINKETRLARQLVDQLGKEKAGKAGNNAITLTDWILLSGGNPSSIAGFLAKKTFSSAGIQSGLAKLLSGKTPKVGIPTAKFGALKPDLTDFLKSIEDQTKKPPLLPQQKVLQKPLPTTIPKTTPQVKKDIPKKKNKKK